MFWIIKLVLSEKPADCFNMFLLRSFWDIQKLIFKLLLWTHILIVQTLQKAVPESLFRLTDFIVRTLEGIRKPLVSCESAPKAALQVYWWVSVSRTLPWIYFHPHQWLTEAFTFITGLLKPGIISHYRVSVRIFIVNKCFHRTSFKMYVYISKELRNK